MSKIFILMEMGDKMNNSIPNSLFLSRLILNPCSRQVIAEIGEPYEMHRTLMRAFPVCYGNRSCSAREEYQVLFRVESGASDEPIRVYVQSSWKPDWSFITEHKDYLSPVWGKAACQCKDIMPAYRRIQRGSPLFFRLRANPTKRIAKQDDPMKGKRVELQREEDQVQWLIRKGQGSDRDCHGGFTVMTEGGVAFTGTDRGVPKLRINPEGKQILRKRLASKTIYFATHLAILYEGFLRVTDKDSFLGTLANGIGPGKAFGFGLLSVAPGPPKGQG